MSKYLIIVLMTLCCVSVYADLLDEMQKGLGQLQKFKGMLDPNNIAQMIQDPAKGTCAHPKTDDGQQANPLEAFQKNLEMFKSCLDQSLAKAVDQVNEKQLQPVFSAFGDSLNRVSKALDDLTATTKGYGTH